MNDIGKNRYYNNLTGKYQYDIKKIIDKNLLD